ncbi:hypothetical protein NDU88_000885 [Pleurodeles waltl]|uniref:Uncharacterized protein n=1 Tax=Pleurodeles waltl TaxID=8319 RepID=A0AAV7TIK0_PLEWA|nr:hypothetical protein NDU88_000885 [Pleurodeles waltl]
MISRSVVSSVSDAGPLTAGCYYIDHRHDCGSGHNAVPEPMVQRVLRSVYRCCRWYRFHYQPEYPGYINVEACPADGRSSAP